MLQGCILWYQDETVWYELLHSMSDRVMNPMMCFNEVSIRVGYIDSTQISYEDFKVSNIGEHQMLETEIFDLHMQIVIAHNHLIKIVCRIN
jgi:hypothetical protein